MRNERYDRRSRARVIDTARPVAQGRPEVDPPEIRLFRAVGEEARLLIGMQVGIEQQNAAFKIDDALDHVAEAA